MQKRAFRNNPPGRGPPPDGRGTRAERGRGVVERNDVVNDGSPSSRETSEETRTRDKERVPARTGPKYFCTRAFPLRGTNS